MLKKVFFKCNVCEFAHEDYMDPDNMESLVYPFNLGEGKGCCPKCDNGTLLYTPDYTPPSISNKDKVFTSTIDSRTLNPGRYQDNKFKAKMEQINKHKEAAYGSKR